MTPDNFISHVVPESWNWKFLSHTASRSGTSVTSLKRLLVVTLAKVVGTGVDNDSALPSVSPGSNIR